MARATGLMLLGFVTTVTAACTAVGVNPELTPASSWSEIRSELDVIPEAPMISFGANAVSVTDVCVDHDKLQTITPEGRIEISRGTIPRDYDIPVDRVVGGGEVFTREFLFTKHFEMPVCGQG